jgi:hypothetical protein
MRNFRTVGVAIVATTVVTACSSVPHEQVQLYTQAFAQAEAAANLVYDEISPIVARQPAASAPTERGALAPVAGPETGTTGSESDLENELLEAGRCAEDLGPLPFETCFDPEATTAGAVPGEPVEVKARRRAMATIALYNEVLVRLNSGASGEELRAEVRSLSLNLGGFLQFANAAAGPIASLAGDIIARLAALQERLRADRELRATLIEGAPVIQELIAALIDETSNLYTIKLRATLEDLGPLRTQINTTRVEIRQLVRRHAAPDDGRLDELSARLERTFGELGIAPMPLPPLAGTQARDPFDAAADQELTRRVEMVEQLTAQYMEMGATLDTFHAALGAYVAMLNDTSMALADLAQSAAAPRTITIDAAELARQVNGIRENASEIQRLLGPV